MSSLPVTGGVGFVGSARRRITGGLVRAGVESLRVGMGRRRPSRSAASSDSPPEALVLHIGGHRTGSTTIQASLAASYDDLLDRGILYPSTGRTPNHPQHGNLAYEVLGHPKHQPELGGRDALLDEIRAIAPRVVVLSSEAFTYRRPVLAAWAGRLCDELGIAEAEVIGYVRPQWEYLESSYPRRVTRWEDVSSFAAYVERHLEGPILDYPTRFGQWQQVFGDRLSIRPYDSDRFPGGDVTQDFWQAVDRLPDHPDRAVKSENLRPGQRLVDMLRLLRQTLADRGLDTVGPLDPVLAQAHRAIRDALPDDPPFRGLTPALVTRIHGQFEESNRRFIEQFGEWHAHLLEPPDIGDRPPPWTIEDASEGERRLFSEVVDQATVTLSRGRRAGRRHPRP